LRNKIKDSILNPSIKSIFFFNIKKKIKRTGMKPKKTYKATLLLPTNGKQDWTNIMYGETKFAYKIYPDEIIVAAYAKFRDGTQVIGGVKKANDETYNIKFFKVLDKNGMAYPDWPIDCSDNEDFHGKGYIFILNDDETIEYHLDIVEKTE
jgi:hypothetical protein